MNNNCCRSDPNIGGMVDIGGGENMVQKFFMSSTAAQQAQQHPQAKILPQLNYESWPDAEKDLRIRAPAKLF